MAININAKTTGVGGLETSADNSGNINIQSGGSTVMSVTSSGVAVTGSFSQNGAVYSTQPSFRNLIINGDMRIDQRNAGASVTQIDGGSFITDRFYNFGTVTSKFTSQQVSDAPDGFNYSLKNTSSSSYTVGSAEQFWVIQKIEGYNIAHLGWGTANAKTVTLSFWVKSSLTGTFGGSLTDINRSYVFSYTITSANTWEKKTITISGDTSGTWNATNGVGVGVYFSLGSGSTYQNTSGSWYSGNYKTATGATSVVGTSGATFYITGVQLEVGSTATEFEHLPYDVELARCQRYCVSYGGVGTYEPFGIGVETSGTNASIQLGLPVTMRGSISLTASNIGDIRVSDGSAFAAVTALNIDQRGLQQVMFNASVSSGLTATRACRLIANNSLAPRIIFTSEL